MKKWKILLWIYGCCLALRLYSNKSGFFGVDSSNDYVDPEQVKTLYYHASVQAKFMSVVINTTLDMLFVVPFALLLYYLLGEKNEYRTLITIISSCVIYDIVFHVLQYIAF